MSVRRLSYCIGFVLAGLPAAALAAPQTVTLLHTADVDQIAPDEGGGGFAPLMTLVEAERAKNPDTIVTFGGDTLSPSILSGLTQGRQMIEMLNAIGTAVAVPGNHEFDFGPAIAETRFGEASFPWVASNITVAGPGASTAEPMPNTVTGHVIAAGDYRIGFLGITTPDTVQLSSPGPDLRFADPIEAATAAAADLKAAGADLVVALTHQDARDDLALLAAVADVDILLGGHDHVALTRYDGEQLLLKPTAQAHHLAAIDIVMDRVEDDGETSLVWRPAWRYEPTLGVAPDPEIQALVDGYDARLGAELNVPVGETAVDLDTRRVTVRGEESNFGNFVADAMRASTGADIAITNGGGIRGDRTYPAGTVITRKDILSELPFGNRTVLIEASGAELLAALENGVSEVEDGGGRFPQVSGMTFAYSLSAPAGSRVRDVTVGGSPLDPARTYTVATNDFMYSGGDGYDALATGRPIIDATSGNLMASSVMNYATAQGGQIAPEVEGRITRLD